MVIIKICPIFVPAFEILPLHSKILEPPQLAAVYHCVSWEPSLSSYTFTTVYH